MPISTWIIFINGYFSIFNIHILIILLCRNTILIANKQKQHCLPGYSSIIINTTTYIHYTPLHYNNRILYDDQTLKNLYVGIYSMRVGKLK